MIFLDRPGRFRYRHGVNLYGAMRAFCTDYTVLVVTGVVLVAALVTLCLMTPTVFAALGITH